MQVDKVVGGGLHLGGIILLNLGAYGCWTLRSSLQESVPDGPGDRGWLTRWFWRWGLERSLEEGRRGTPQVCSFQTPLKQETGLGGP